MDQPHPFTRGFSLLEMAIVIGIIALLVGGILTGMNLMRAAELRSVVTDLETYRTTIEAFKNKYASLPGDMHNASSLWSECQDNGSNPCNGNEDGMVDSPTCGGCPVSEQSEFLRAWQHLSLAGMIEGKYTGNYGAGGHIVIGESIPSSRIDGGGFTYRNHSAYGVSANGIQFGAAAGDYPIARGIVNSADAYAIDLKVDDGVADKGLITTMDGVDAVQPGCIHEAGVYPNDTGVYNLSDTDRSCRMWLWVDKL